ncbi:MAG: CocE/NonD family hydrolase, partial [Gemmatimonadaceae bacterium]
MRLSRHFRPLLLAAALRAPQAALPAQGFGAPSAEELERRARVRAELDAVAIIDRKVMMPMRDGVRLATDIYRPKHAAPGSVPTIFVRTPYNFNYWDVRNGVERDMSTVLTAVKRGYAYVNQNER